MSSIHQYMQTKAERLEGSVKPVALNINKSKRNKITRINADQQNPITIKGVELEDIESLVDLVASNR